jgi:polysaccharide pyruvyl transferase WcaK-like protein
MIETHGCSVLMIPMTFGGGLRSDREALETLRSRSGHASRYVMAPDHLKPPQLKFLFSRARAAVVSRHHAMVFAITSGVPCTAMVLDPYYHMKLRGVADEYPGLVTLVARDDVTTPVLTDAVERAFEAGRTGTAA